MNITGVWLFDNFGFLWVLAASAFASLMPMSVLFFGLRWLGRDARARGLIRRRLLPDACSNCVSRNASVSVAWEGCSLPVDTCQSHFFFKRLEFSDTVEVKCRNARLLH